MLIEIILIAAILIPLISFYDQRLALALNVLYICLVPNTISLLPFGLPLSIKYIAIIPYYINFYVMSKNKFFFEYVKPFFFLYIGLLFLMPFQTLHFSQLDKWFSSLLAVTIFQTILSDGYKKDHRFFVFFNYAFIILIVITCLYGLFILFVGELNPYYIYLETAKGTSYIEDREVWFHAEDRLFGRSQSTFGHPLTWGVFLVLSFSCFCIRALKNTNKLNISILVLVFINVLICGVRSSFVSILFFLFLLFLFYLKVKNKIIFGTLFFSFALLVITTNSELYDYLFSVFDFIGSKVGGSSLSMRIDQLFACFELLGNGLELFVGKGYGFVGYYLANFGMHPKLMGFESFIYSVLCESGIVGLFLWGVFYINLIKLNKRKLSAENKVLMNILVATYFIYTLFTGSYFFILYFSYIYIYMLIYLESQDDLKKEIV